MNEITLMSKYFWIVFIVVTFLNVYMMKKKVKEEVVKNPHLEQGNNQIFKVMLTWGNLPWVVMGIGIITKNVPTVFHYFRPQDNNFNVWAFYASIFLVYGLLAKWIFFKGGASFLLEHTAAFNNKFKSITLIKVFIVLALLMNVVVIIAMYQMDFPVNKLLQK